MWYCDGCNDKFETEKEALEHEKKCQKAIDLAKRQEEEKKRREEADKERLLLEEEKRQREREKKILLQNKILEEEKELELFTYHSMKSDSRFPYLNLYITLLKIFAVLALAIGIILFVISVDEGLGIFGLFVVVYALFMALGFLMASESIRFLLDFHNNNHTNTKVKIETLKILEKISDKLDKWD